MIDIAQILGFLRENKTTVLILVIILAVLCVVLLTGISIRIGDNRVDINASLNNSQVSVTVCQDHEPNPAHPSIDIRCNDNGQYFKIPKLVNST